MTQFLPGNLLALFAPRDPIPYLPPVDKLPYEKNTAGYTGISAFLSEFENPADTPAPTRIETREERQERRRKEKAELVAYKLEQDIALWSPSTNPYATSDPFKTLFVARINYDSSEAKLKREFGNYGGIRKMHVVTNNETGKARGYAFIEYEHERDMHAAYKHADGKKIDGRRVLVDVERGRTVTGWLPRRLGGGLGGTRRGGPEVNVKHSGREENRLEDRYIGGGGGGGGGGGIKDRPMDRDRERVERPERRRSRSRSRERRRRSRSRSRERHRSERHRRDRSRDRGKARLDRDVGAGGEKADANMDVSGDGVPEAEPPRKERRRSRSRDRDRKRRRSRSRDRKRRDHDRDRDRDRESRRERGGGEERNREDVSERVTIKEEPVDPEPTQDTFSNSGYDGEYNNYNNNGETNNNEYEGY